MLSLLPVDSNNLTIEREREKEIRSRNIVIIIIIITITIAEIMAQRDASAASNRPEIYKEDGFG